MWEADGGPQVWSRSDPWYLVADQITGVKGSVWVLGLMMLTTRAGNTEGDAPELLFIPRSSSSTYSFATVWHV